jgi:hypothetical protein
MSEAVSEATAKAKRDRSPSFPFISLRVATERLVAFEKYFSRHPAPAKKAGLAWGMKAESSQAAQTLAAIKAFGFVDYKGSGADLEATLSEDGRTYLRAQQESVKSEVLTRAALRPKAIAKYWQLWGADRPPDPICLDQLVLKDAFTQPAAETFLRVYDDTIAFARLSRSDTVTSNRDHEEGIEDDDGRGDPPPPPPPALKVGDYVQWISAGVEQFKQPRKIVEIFPDGKHAQVFGSQTGIPMSDLHLAEGPHRGVSPTLKGSAENSGARDTKDDISVLMTGDRLQITADVDSSGIGKLKEMLTLYEGILKLAKN